MFKNNYILFKFLMFVKAQHVFQLIVMNTFVLYNCIYRGFIILKNNNKHITNP